MSSQSTVVQASTEQKKDTKFNFTDEWGTPQPVEDELLPVMTFDENFLPAAIRPWVRDVAERMSLPLDFTGPCALVTIAGVIGRRAFVYPKAFDKTWKEAIALSGLIIAPSGSKKTPCWKTFVNPVFEVDINWREKHSEETEKYRAEQERWEKSKKKSNDELYAEEHPEPQPPNEALTSDPRWQKYERDLEKWKKDKETYVRPQPPSEPPTARRCILGDSTPEAMHQIMEDNPEGLLYYRDEMSSWVMEMEKKGYEVQRGLFLAAMNGNDMYPVDRIGRGHVFATMSASLFGGFQPEMFKEFLSNSRNVSSGMIPRFAFLIWPDKQKRTLVDRATNEEADQKFRKILRTLADLNAESINLHFDDAAQLAYNEWSELLEDKISKEKNPGKASHLSKYSGALPKIAGLLQLVDLVVSGKTPELSGSHRIDLAHFKMAASLMVYLEGHMTRAYSCTRTPLRAAEFSLVEHLKVGDLKDGFYLRDVQRKQWTGLKEKGVIELALEVLEEKGWVRARAVASKSGGWPTKRWDINPQIAQERNTAS